jgi:ATP-dependent helicase Lhr and Lhr-like helicase
MSSSIQARLRRTWPVFFARHGNLNQTQQAAIPPILAGQNTLLIAPTATGKTEAVIAPLLERHLLRPDVTPSGLALCILYICPTRALVRDLYERLRTPLADLGVLFMMKSGDTGPVPVQRPPSVLLTTPESLDSLLTRAPRLFGPVRAVVLDEIHLFDATPRGDHLRCLLKRVEHIRTYQAQTMSRQAALPLQRVALSATIPNPDALAERYLVEAGQVEPPAIVQVAGVRQMAGSLQPMATLHDLVAVLDAQMGGAGRMRKTLVFCNARHEVEQTAAYLREHLPFECPVFVHYSNLDPALRREVEDGLAQAASAICVCTSTLELGIDIGSIDMVVLVGPPPTPAAFVQRIGRAGRRRRTAHVVGLARSRLEELHFQALFHLIETNAPQVAPKSAPETNCPAAHAFYPSVLVQQIFSILKQSPTGGIRLADLRRVIPDPAPDFVDDETLGQLFNHLGSLGYLKPGRAGEWRAGAALAELADAHEIYSNIGSSSQPIVVVDAYTGRPIAQNERLRAPGETMFVGGRLVEVVWRAQYRLGVRAAPASAMARAGGADAELRSDWVPFSVSPAVSQAVAALLGFSAGQMALLQAEEGSWLFHFWGDIYGELLAQILRVQLAPDDSMMDEQELPPAARANAHCLRLAEPLLALPAWQGQTVQQQLHRLLPRLESFLELGRFHALLPTNVAARAVVAQVDLACFEQLYRSATIVQPTPEQGRRLLSLVR